MDFAFVMLAERVKEVLRVVVISLMVMVVTVMIS